MLGKRQLVLTALGLLGVFLVGCDMSQVSTNPNNPGDQTVQADDALSNEGNLLAADAESFFSDLLSPASVSFRPMAEPNRPVTVVRENDGITVLTSPGSYQLGSTPSLNGLQALVIKCPSRSPCYAYLGVVRGDNQSGYRMTWYGARNSAGVRQTEEVNVKISTLNDSLSGGSAQGQKPVWSYNRIGSDRSWMDTKLSWPANSASTGLSVHALFSLPTTIPGQPIERRLRDDGFLETVTSFLYSVPRPFEHEPPIYLKRGDVSLVLFPKRYGGFDDAQSLDDLFGGKAYVDLGLAVYRQVLQGELVSEVRHKVLELRLIKEGQTYAVLGRDLRDNTYVNFSLAQVSWCSVYACPTQDPKPRYIGIEDRLGQPPLLDLQLGKLMLQGIEKR